MKNGKQVRISEAFLWVSQQTLELSKHFIFLNADEQTLLEVQELIDLAQRIGDRVLSTHTPATGGESQSVNTTSRQRE
jgi:hypothetical protein